MEAVAAVLRARGVTSPRVIGGAAGTRPLVVDPVMIAAFIVYVGLQSFAATVVPDS